MNAGTRTQDADARLTILLDVVGSFKTASVEVFCWRAEQLEEAGYDARTSLALARRADIDLHQACDLLAAGCPQELALRILP